MALTPKQELFARVYVETGNASEAYRQAYDVGEDAKPEGIWVNASKTLAKANVALRVMELQQAHAERHNVTVDSLTRELDEDRELARREAMPSAAISAVLGKAKLHGLLTDKTEHSGQVIVNKVERAFKKPKC